MLPAEVAGEAARIVRPLLTAPGGAVLETDLLHMRRDHGTGQVWFLANPWDAVLALDIELPGSGIESLDTAGAPPLGARPRGERVGVRLELPPRGHALWWVDGTARPATGPRPAQSVNVRAGAARRVDPNVLVLDYADLTWHGGQRESLHFMPANGTIWSVAGFERPLWEWTVQFKRTFLDAVPSDDSGHALAWHFDIDERVDGAVLGSLRFAMERPWLYKLEINGHALTSPAEPWLDEDARSFAIGAWVRRGANTVTARAARFQQSHEIAPAYVLGDFGLAPAGKGFRILPPAAIHAESWRASGLHFYAGRVEQEFEFTLASAARAVRVTLPAWAGSAARIRLGGDDRVVLHAPYIATFGPLAEGTHRLAVELTGNFKNMMGPFFNDGLPGPWSWSDSPEQQPPGASYRLHDCGLTGIPAVEAD
jgi:hypothetical protein